MKKKISALTVIIILLIMSFNGCIDDSTDKSRIIYVDDDGDVDFMHIQDAIENASNGDRIFVHNGTYYERLIINKSINLIGASREKTIIIYNSSNESSEIDIIRINTNECRIEKFKIIGPNDSSETIGINIDSSDNNISNNIIHGTYRGVIIGRDARNNNVSRNSFYNNTYGIFVYVSYDNNIFTNNISNNFNGIRMVNSENNMVFNNNIRLNQQGILTCCGSGNNYIYLNNFIENNEWNARDELFNKWNYGILGNYWDDYVGEDNDGDGIGDTPYNIPNKHGGSNTKDSYPVMNPIEI